MYTVSLDEYRRVRDSREEVVGLGKCDSLLTTKFPGGRDEYKCPDCDPNLIQLYNLKPC